MQIACKRRTIEEIGKIICLMWFGLLTATDMIWIPQKKEVIIILWRATNHIFMQILTLKGFGQVRGVCWYVAYSIMIISNHSALAKFYRCQNTTATLILMSALRFTCEKLVQPTWRLAYSYNIACGQCNFLFRQVSANKTSTLHSIYRKTLASQLRRLSAVTGVGFRIRTIRSERRDGGWSTAGTKCRFQGKQRLVWPQEIWQKSNLRQC